MYAKQKGEVLLTKKHESSPEIARRVDQLMRRWNELLRASAERGKGLEEAKDLLKFNEEVDKVEAWIREKVRTHKQTNKQTNKQKLTNTVI